MLDKVRKIALQLPHVTEDVKWGVDLCFCIHKKMFCVATLEGPLKISFKVPDEDFEELCVRPGFMPAPYVARYKWVLADVNQVSKKELEHFIRQSYELVIAKLPKKMRL